MRDKNTTTNRRFIPSSNLGQITAYRVSRLTTPVDMYLDGNEGCNPDLSNYASEVMTDPDLIRRYPDASKLEARIAGRFGISVDRVLVTAGGDEAIDRICRTALGPGRTMILPSPTFSMFRHYATLAGGTISTVAWPEGPYPVNAVLDDIDESTSLIIVVSPNNPTGEVSTGADIRRLAEAAPHALILIDLAYIEFADEDPTVLALEYDNCVVVHSMSKAWGLAGLRVGYVLAATQVIEWLRKAGGPYSVASLSLALAEKVLESSEQIDAYRRSVQIDRDSLTTTLRELGTQPIDSQGNFVLCHSGRADWIHRGLSGLGIAVRRFSDDPDLTDAVRITLPSEGQLKRLLQALRIVLAPQALLFDMDGVLADVSRSYRRAIVQTANSFGAIVIPEDITRCKRAGNANNDWELTWSLLKERNIEVSFEIVKQCFKAIYQGTEGNPGLWEQERPVCQRELLERLKRIVPLGIVTGRPRSDAERFLTNTGLQGIFDVVVCMEDAPAKPSPKPIIRALERLNVTRAWMVGDTPDDIRAARSAGVLPLGIIAPGDSSDTRESLFTAGTGRVLESLDELMELLP